MEVVTVVKYAVEQYVSCVRFLSFESSVCVPCEAFVYVEAEVLYYIRGGGQRANRIPYNRKKEDRRTKTFIEGEDTLV